MVYAKLFAIYIDDLSQDLAMCKSGCYISEHCMNHVMYADDICLLAPSAFGLQRLLDVCFDFSIRNDIMFKPIKSVCVVFKFKSNKLYCPTVSLDCDILEYTAYTKYLGFTFSMNVQDDDDMLRQMRTLYIKSNKLLRTFIIVLLTLNWNYSEVFVPHFSVVIYGLHTKNQHLISCVWPLTMLIDMFSVCHGDLVPVQCMLTLVFKILKQSLESLLLDLHNVWPKALILLLWLLKVHGLYVLIYGTSGKRHSTLLPQHKFFFLFLTDAF